MRFVRRMKKQHYKSSVRLTADPEKLSRNDVIIAGCPGLLPARHPILWDLLPRVRPLEGEDV